jgi:Raf kinase inhibitor-like YbhB/YbcL family protein
MTMRVESSAFADGGSIPRKYTCDGQDLSPPLKWSGVPQNAKSLALICEDPDAPAGTWTHWVLCDLPPDLNELPEGVPADPVLKLGSNPDFKPSQGTNDFKKIGYGGPCPPRGTHHYLILVYALDTRPSVKAGATKPELVRAMMGHIAAFGRLVGTYSR